MNSQDQMLSLLVPLTKEKDFVMNGFHSFMQSLQLHVQELKQGMITREGNTL